MTDKPGQCCPQCERWLPLAAFDEHPELRSGGHAWCHACIRQAKGLDPGPRRGSIEVAVKDLRPGRLQ